jgi:predicted ribosomally synthesized peptide with nif11-like leader
MRLSGGMVTATAVGAKLEAYTPFSAMSEEQLAALLAKLKDDAGLQEKLKGAADLDAAVALAKEAGFDVSKADWLKYQAQQTLELNDEELEGIAGGRGKRNSPVVDLKETQDDICSRYADLLDKSSPKLM